MHQQYQQKKTTATAADFQQQYLVLSETVNKGNHTETSSLDYALCMASRSGREFHGIVPPDNRCRCPFTLVLLIDDAKRTECFVSVYKWDEESSVGCCCCCCLPLSAEA